MSRYTRQHVLIQWDLGGTPGYGAFQIRFNPDAGPEHESFPIDYGYDLNGDLQFVEMDRKKQLVAEILLYNGYTTETVNYDSQDYDLLTPDELKSVFYTEIYQIKRHVDTAFWDAKILSPWQPWLLTPDGEYMVLPVFIAEQ